MTAIAITVNAKPAASTPPASGATARLAATAAIAIPAIRPQRPGSGQATLSSRFGSILGSSRTRMDSAASADIRWHRPTRRHADSAEQLGPQFLCHDVSIDAVADHLRSDEDDELGAVDHLGAMREGVAQPRNLIEQRYSAAIAGMALADQTRQQHGLPARDGDRALDLALGHRGGQRGAGRRVGNDVADLLLDVQTNIAVDVHARHDAQDDAGVAIIDGVDDGVAGREHGGAAGRDR